jgi:hypothetical protein
VTALFEKWKSANAPRLRDIAIDGKPKALIETLSEDLLETFRQARLLDPYDVYQHLMDYWTETTPRRTKSPSPPSSPTWTLRSRRSNRNATRPACSSKA